MEELCKSQIYRPTLSKRFRTRKRSGLYWPKRSVVESYSSHCFALLNAKRTTHRQNVASFKVMLWEKRGWTVADTHAGPVSSLTPTTLDHSAFAGVLSKGERTFDSHKAAGTIGFRHTLQEFAHPHSLTTVAMQAHEPLLNEDEAAQILTVEPQTLAVWRSTGRYNLPFIRMGRLIRYRRADLDAWLESRVVGGKQLQKEQRA